MTLDLSIPREEGFAEEAVLHSHTPRIGVIGIGCGGANAINNLARRDLAAVRLMVADTDANVLNRTQTSHRIQLGPELTKGWGAGVDPDVGRRAAEEVADAIRDQLRGLNLLFIVASLGGGTGTGAAPVIARLAKEMDVLNVSMVTKPINRARTAIENAQMGIENLSPVTDTLTVASNERLLRLAPRGEGIEESLYRMDNILCDAVCGLMDLILRPGIMNLDFADIRRVLVRGGMAQMGSGEASGDARAVEAVNKALNNPFLEHGSLAGAQKILVNIIGGKSVSIAEIDGVMARLQEVVGEETFICPGVTLDDNMGETMRITLWATGIDETYSPFIASPEITAGADVHHEGEALQEEDAPQEKKSWLASIFAKEPQDDEDETLEEAQEESSSLFEQEAWHMESAGEPQWHNGKEHLHQEKPDFIEEHK